MDRQLSNTDSQDSGPVSNFSMEQPVEPSVTTPEAPAVIPMEALLTITRALSSAGS